MTRYWRRIGAALRATIELAVAHGYATTADIRRLASHRRKPAHAIGRDWVASGYFRRVGSRAKARYVPTRKAVEALDCLQSMPAALLQLREQLDVLRHRIGKHGAINVAMAAKAMRVSHGTASCRLHRWVRAGALRRSHYDTYRLPLGPTLGSPAAPRV